MIRSLIICTLVLILSQGLYGQFSRLNNASNTRINQLVQEKMEEYNIVGASVGIVKDGEIVFLQGYGFADKENQVPATECTLYRTGSVQKTFTAVAALQLIEAGKMSLDDDIRKFVPEFTSCPDGFSVCSISIRNLLQHTNCIHNDSNTNRRYTNENYSYNASEAMKLFKDQPFTENCIIGGSPAVYSNNGYNLLGLIVERASGIPFEIYMKERILSPLKIPLYQTEYFWREPIISKGYFENGDEVGFDLYPIGEFLHHLPCGGVIASATDLTIFCEGFINNSLFRSLSNRSSMTDFGSGRDWQTWRENGTIQTIRFSLGLQCRFRTPKTFYFHAGSHHGYSSIIYFIPASDGARATDLNDAVVIVTNRDGLATRIMEVIAYEFSGLLSDITVTRPTPYKKTGAPATSRINLTGTQNGSKVEIAREIVAQNYSINSGADVKLDANKIILRPGFRAREGSKFLAHMGNPNTGCPPQN